MDNDRHLHDRVFGFHVDGVIVVWRFLHWVVRGVDPQIVVLGWSVLGCLQCGYLPELPLLNLIVQNWALIQMKFCLEPKLFILGLLVPRLLHIECFRENVVICSSVCSVSLWRHLVARLSTLLIWKLVRLRIVRVDRLISFLRVLIQDLMVHFRLVRLIQLLAAKSYYAIISILIKHHILQYIWLVL